MKKVKVVIGKNFGDEGKGAAVHSLCGQDGTLVVRHNGGAQAGHTVEDGSFRFVFHQLGSGSYRRCPTYWSETFLPDLLKLGEEIQEFTAEAGIPPVILAHPECACVTVFDVLLNSLTEELRCGAKHGSCGMGIYEACMRERNEKYRLHLKDFAENSPDIVGARMSSIQNEYVPKRLSELKREYGEHWEGESARRFRQLLGNEHICANACEIMLENYRRYVRPAKWERLAGCYDTIIFENAQGLMLSCDNMEYYPHLTPSYTGLTNVAALLERAPGWTKVDLEIFYVTRTYVTRHGAGRLDYACSKEEINAYMEDRTNVPNQWQDSLRYGRHPGGEAFFSYIKEDLKRLPCLLTPKAAIWLTHLDETSDRILFADGEMSKEEFVRWCREAGNIRVVF